MKMLPIFLLIFGIQAVVLYLIDPLGCADTIRYLNLADFLQHPAVAHYGDLAGNNGLLFTPLFLPFFLAFFKKILQLPYLFSGALLQVISFQLVIWLSYATAQRIDGDRTAKLVVVLLLSHLVFCVYSGFILTEYPFMAVLLFIVYYILINDTINRGQAFVLSLIFGLLVSIRVQGFLYIAAIVSFLLYSKKTRFSYIPIFCSIPIAYLLFYVCFYVFLNHGFPLTVTMNEVFSVNLFLLGSDPERYNFFVHGLEALIPRSAASYTSLFDIKTYVDGIAAQYSNFAHILKPGRMTCYLFFAELMCIAFFFSRIKRKSFLVFLIIFNFIAITFLPVSYESLVRYQTSLFPLAVILIASCFLHCNEESGRKSNFRRSILYLSVFLYGLYFVIRQFDFFQSVGPGDYTRRMVLRKEAIASARLISDGIGRDRNTVAAYPIYYNTVYRSGNIPVYFFEGWERSAIVDYVKARSLRYLVCQYDVIVRLKKKDIGVHIMRPLLKAVNPVDQLFLCELSIA